MRRNKKFGPRKTVDFGAQVIEVKSMKLGSKKKGKSDLMGKMAAEDGLDVRAFAPKTPAPGPKSNSSVPF